MAQTATTPYTGMSSMLLVYADDLVVRNTEQLKNMLVPVFTLLVHYYLALIVGCYNPEHYGGWAV